MINQFRTLNPVNLLILLVYTFFMRLAIFFHVPPELHFEFLESYAKVLIQIPVDDMLSPLANISIAALFVYLQAILFNQVINRHGLFARACYLPALLYVTTASLFLPFLVLSPTLICNFLLIWMMDKFLRLGKSTGAVTLLFDTGMLIAAGTMIYFPFIVMMLMIWLTLMLYRSFNWREWISGLVGFLTIFFFIAVYYYWNDSISLFYRIWLPLGNKFPSVFTINYSDYLVLIPVLIILLLASTQLRENFFRSFISTRKAFQMLFFMFLIALLSFYAKGDFRLYHFLLSVPPASVLLAYYFSNARKRWFYESLFLLYVLTIQYFLFV